MKEVPKCLLRKFPKIVLVEASNAVLAKKGVLRGSFANAVSKVFIECVPKSESYEGGYEKKSGRKSPRGWGFRKESEKGLLKDVSRYIPKEVTKK